MSARGQGLRETITFGGCGPSERKSIVEAGIWMDTLATVAIVGAGGLALGRWLRAQMDDRFKEVNRRFEAAEKSSDRQFAENREAHSAISASIRESEARILEFMGQRFNDAGKRMDELSKRIDDLRSSGVRAAGTVGGATAAKR